MTRTVKSLLLKLVMMFFVVVLISIPMSGTALASGANDRADNSEDSEDSGSGDTMKSDGSANSRAAIMMALAKNFGDDNSKDVDLTKMSAKDFRYFGVYMSNFYAPYVTEVGTESEAEDTGDKKKDDESKKNKETQDKIKEAQLKTMQDTMGVSEVNANILQSTINNVSWDSASDLKFGFAKTNYTKPDDLVTGVDKDGKVKKDKTKKGGPAGAEVTLYQLNKMISGQFGYGSPAQSIDGSSGNGKWGKATDPKDGHANESLCSIGNGRADSETKGAKGKDLLDCWKTIYDDYKDEGKDGDNSLTEIERIVYQGYNYAYLLTPDGKPVFSMDLTADYTTPSVAALAFASDSMNTGKGYGPNILDYMNPNDKKTVESLANSKKSLGKEGTNIGTKLKVDAFGNLIADGPLHKFIVLPAAMNPFIWEKLDEKGNPDTKDIPGTFLNPANAMMMSHASEGKLCRGDSNGDECKVDMRGINNARDSLTKIKNPKGGDKKYWEDGPADKTPPLRKDGKGQANPVYKVARNTDKTDITAKDSDLWDWVNLKNKKKTKEGTITNKAFLDYAKQGRKAYDSPLMKIYASGTQGKEYPDPTEFAEPWFGGRGIGMEATNVPMVNKAMGVKDILGMYEGDADGEDKDTFGATDIIDKDGKLFSQGKLNDDKKDGKGLSEVWKDDDPAYQDGWKDPKDILGKGAYTNLYATYVMASMTEQGSGDEDSSDGGSDSGGGSEDSDEGSEDSGDEEGSEDSDEGSESSDEGSEDSGNDVPTEVPAHDEDESEDSGDEEGSSDSGDEEGSEDSGDEEGSEDSGDEDSKDDESSSSSSSDDIYKTPTETSKAQGKSLGYRMNLSDLPDVCESINDDESIDNCNFTMSDEDKKKAGEANKSQMDDDIRNWIWYILNPTEGFNYVTYLIKNKSTATLMGIHSDILGTTNAPIIAGSTKYLGFSGYVTMPELSDIEWADKAVDTYNSNYIYIIVVIVFIMGVYAVTGVLTLQRAIGGAILMSVCAILPAQLLDSTINISNNITSIMYGDKFTYWALMQNETYSKAIDKSASEGDYEDYLRTQMQENQKIDITGADAGADGNGVTNKGSDSVVVRWQGAKKMRTLMMNPDASEAEKAMMNNGGALMDNFLNQYDLGNSGQSFMDEGFVYMYRSYIDLNNFSRFIYKGLNNDTQGYKEDPDTSKWPEHLKKAWDERKNKFSADVQDGYVNPNKDGSTDINEGLRVTAPMSSSVYADIFPQVNEMEDLNLESKVGLDTKTFDYSLKAYNNGTDMIDSIRETSKRFGRDDWDPSQDGKYDNEDYGGLGAYAIMSENPYYYFSWSLYDQGMDPDGEESYKDLLLNSSDGENSFFYNTGGNGEMKDYMDMKSMFTYVIPYLKAGNDVVRRYDNMMGGMEYTPGVPTTEGRENDEAIKSDPVLQQKYWKNLQTSRLSGIYSPWVDLLYDTKYAESQDIMVQGEKVTIKDPFNPATYPEDRPMVFSKSEQSDWGIDDGQLTTVEKKIQEVEENSMEGMFKLLNAYNFQDNVLNTAAAMENNFEFNKAFSDTKIVGDSVTLYPQSYELKNFSYDAYLRLILANATGEDINGESANDFYDKIVQSSSVFTAVVMIILDITSVYIIPAFKVFLILGVGIIMVLVIISTAIRIMDGVWKNLFNGIVKPLAGLMAIAIGHGWLVSLFMSNGNTSVTGYDGTSISLGDPVMTMLAMIVMNIVVIYLYWLVLKNVWGSLRFFGKSVVSSFAGVAQGIGGMAKSMANGKSFSQARGDASSHKALASGALAGAGTAAAVTAATRAERGKSRVRPIRTATQAAKKVGGGVKRTTGKVNRFVRGSGTSEKDKYYKRMNREEKQRKKDEINSRSRRFRDSSDSRPEKPRRVRNRGRGTRSRRRSRE